MVSSIRSWFDIHDLLDDNHPLSPVFWKKLPLKVYTFQDCGTFNIRHHGTNENLGDKNTDYSGNEPDSPGDEDNLDDEENNVEDMMLEVNHIDSDGNETGNDKEKGSSYFNSLSHSRSPSNASTVSLSKKARHYKFSQNRVGK